MLPLHTVAVFVKGLFHSGVQVVLFARCHGRVLAGEGPVGSWWSRELSDFIMMPPPGGLLCRWAKWLDDFRPGRKAPPSSSS